MSIVPLLQGQVFGPDMTKVMGMAFDAACKHLDGDGQAKVKELLAKRILKAARSGERDPERLCAIALDEQGSQ
jgi:hypothetical protein